MREIIEIERLGNAAAASLAGYLTSELGLSAELLAVRGSCIEVETQSGSLPELLSALEAWGQQSAVSSLCVRLNGRSYILENPKMANTSRPATA
jgi:hypothetical protein